MPEAGIDGVGDTKDHCSDTKLEQSHISRSAPRDSDDDKHHAGCDEGQDIGNHVTTPSARGSNGSKAGVLGDTQ